ncbi:AEC family transporter [Pseudomonas sp. G11-1]|uniref:AEC family transporter n=1 Tax=Halopseudomonas bauzanensis TaxID=653930 RepID=A0A031MJ25_9GAMM|nr:MULTISPECIES: AEC family transporter [Halopseudomonas]MCO5787569.1 AEC family transporter [Pseudomonas sp. G11-1]MCO5790700.1 AEC family transporter [Pseudomonas sp. G11-2]EZQ20046.1 transporter [Halopseudomonas bauzanensis]TKA91481.1 AEC family transporter [Halopseudomonas bauzanensis]WGK60178.1 AEC family transporter [Halopseudomonas sp. SMJS2]
MFFELFAVMAPVLIVAGIGYGWARSGQAYPTEFVTRLVLNISTPCLVLSTLSRAEIDLEIFGQMALGCVVITLLMAVVGWVLSRTINADPKVLVPAYMFPNTGNMGLPISLYAFGEPGLALAVAFFVVLSVGHFSVGMILSGAAESWRRLLLNPVILSLGVALVVLLLDLQLPRWLGNTIDLLGSLSIPMMLLTLGVSLASIRPKQVGKGMALGGLRMLCGAAIGWGIALALDLPPLAQGVLVLQAAMPVAVFNYLFAVKANRSPETVASLVICSTLLSFIFIPLLLIWWLPAAG